MPRNHLTPALIVTLLAVALAGCRNESRLASQLPTPNGPIAVQARVDGKATVTTALNGNDPDVTIHFGDNRQIVVTQSRILIDNDIYPSAPPGTKTIAIDVSGGQVTLTADDTPISK